MGGCDQLVGELMQREGERYEHVWVCLIAVGRWWDENWVCSERMHVTSEQTVHHADHL